MKLVAANHVCTAIALFAIRETVVPVYLIAELKVARGVFSTTRDAAFIAMAVSWAAPEAEPSALAAKSRKARKRNGLGFSPARAERRTKVNKLQRRNFLKLCPGIIAVGRYGMPPQLVNPSNATVEEALSLVRTLNTIELRFLQKGAYASKSDLVGPDGLAGAIQQTKTEHPEIVWVRRVHLESDEILDGWVLDYDSKPNGYVLILWERLDPKKPSATRNALITDQGGVIYRASVSRDKQPKARGLASAKDFPGAVPHDKFAEPAPAHL